VGPILVSVNPYKVLTNHHGEAHLQRFAQAKAKADGSGSPHIYGVAAAAYQRLLTENRDQSVLIRYLRTYDAGG
jgi:myosin heavy subunit